jgi:hypothetical protein
VDIGGSKSKSAQLPENGKAVLALNDAAEQEQHEEKQTRDNNIELSLIEPPLHLYF